MMEAGLRVEKQRRITMKRLAVLTKAGMALVLVAGASAAYAQAIFKVPFKFEAAGKKCAAGEYAIAGVGDAQFTLRQVSTGKEVQILFLKKLPQPNPPVEGPQLLFDAVGNFEPSYTEYFTVYVLSEVWLPGQDGLLVHTTKGSHQTRTVKGENPGK
jgi:hypothetical protein